MKVSTIVVNATTNPKAFEAKVALVDSAIATLNVQTFGADSKEESESDARWAATVINRCAEMLLPDPPRAQPTDNDGFSSFLPGLSGALSRRDLVDSMIDPRRRVDRECGYPEAPDAFLFRLLYERDPIAYRVVKCFPEECWKSDPEIYEDEDEDEETEFEIGWKDLLERLHLWTMLHRADELSRIGRYGVLLLGTDDGDDYSTPLEGINERGERVDNKGESEKLPNGDPNPAFNEKDCPTHRVLFVKPFDETCLRINMRETHTENPRFGQPVSYTLLFMDTDVNMGGAGLATQVQITRRVHWTRVIHLADNLQMSEIFGLSAMQPVLNPILDARKTRGGSAEGYWRGAVPTLSLELAPGVQTSDVNKEEIRKEIAKLGNSLDRFIMLAGLTVKPVMSQTPDPTSHIASHMEAIAIALGIPKRILFGSERGELSSSQDAKSWNDRLAGRQTKHITPNIIRRFVDRLIMLGVLAKPENYTVKWPDLQNSTDAERAGVAQQETAALSQYAQSGADAVVPRQSFLRNVMRWDKKKIEQNEEDLEEQQGAEKDLEAEAIAKGLVPAHAGVPGKPGSGQEPKAPAEAQEQEEREAP